MSPDDPRHGTVAGYNAHRRNAVEPCEECRRAMATYGARLAWDHMNGRVRKLDATGTARRIQALVYLGYTFGEIGAELGVSHDVARHYAVSRATVRTATAQKVDALYERWSMTPAPESRRAKYARTTAARNGWVPPLAWMDIDDPAERPAVRRTNAPTPIRERTWDSPDHRACGRCGIVREVNRTNERGPTDLCRDCYEAAA